MNTGGGMTPCPELLTVAPRLMACLFVLLLRRCRRAARGTDATRHIDGPGDPGRHPGKSVPAGKRDPLVTLLRRPHSNELGMACAYV